jgi:hypothetical protein
LRKREQNKINNKKDEFLLSQMIFVEETNGFGPESENGVEFDLNMLT